MQAASPLQTASQRVTLELGGPVAIVSWVLLVLSGTFNSFSSNTQELPCLHYNLVPNENKARKHVFQSPYSKRHTKSSIHLNLEGSESVLRLVGAGDVSNTLLLDR